MGYGEGYAFGARGDYVEALAAVVGKGWAKGERYPPEGPKCRGGRDWRRQDRVGRGGEGGGRRSRRGDGVGQTRQRVWGQGARNA